MTKRALLLLLVGASFLVSGCAAAAQTIPQKPNILVVLTDDQDVDSVSEMPNVRAEFAERGTTFSRKGVR